MAIVLYSNGIVEEFKPMELIFNEDELIKSFGDYKNIRSKRVVELANTWCIWGEMENPDPIEFNRICTDILEIYVFSHVMFIHDSELDPSWQISDMIYKSYTDFKTDLNLFIEEMSQRIIDEADQMQADGSVNNMIFLTQAGQTKDKHVVYMFNPLEQSEGFYNDDSFSNFTDKVVDYLQNKIKLSEDLTIFADTKIIIAVEKDHVPKLFKQMLTNFEQKEDYETCSILTTMFNNWEKFTQKKKPGRPRKNSKKN